MAWVRVVPEDKADGELREVYDRIRGQRGAVANVINVMSLLPEVMQGNVDHYLALMYGPHRLPRAEREMLAVEVSRANRCEYCVQHHAAAFQRVTHDDARTRQLVQGDTAAWSPRERALLAYARKLTLTPAAMGPADVEGLRKAGLADEEVLAAALVVAYFNQMNRVVNGLGVELEPDHGADPRYKY